MIIFILSYVMSSHTLSAGVPLERSKSRIAYVVPYQAGSLYWAQTFDVMEKVAKNLDFDFVHYDYEEKTAAATHDKLLRTIRSDQRPDAIILAVAGEFAIPLLEAAEQNHVSVIIQRTLTPEELAAVGYEARRKYKHWIASFRQDEVEKGYDSATALFELISQNKGKDANVELVALSGPGNATTSSLRIVGLQKALKRFPNIILKEVAYTDWSPEQARKNMERLLKLYPNIGAVWATSDQLAVSALQTGALAGKKPGVDIFGSGIDLSELGLNSISKGELGASSAMSMLGFAEMLIYIYDFLQGIDFAQEAGTLIMPDIVTANHSNAVQHLQLYKKMSKINFRRFSKSYNRDLRRYNMSLSAFFGDVGIHPCRAATKDSNSCFPSIKPSPDKKTSR